MESKKELLELPLEERAILALRAAVRKAIAERKRAGLPVYIWSKGKVVELGSRRPARSTARTSEATR
jgi:hypothetical protein